MAARELAQSARHVRHGRGLAMKPARCPGREQTGTSCPEQESRPARAPSSTRQGCSGCGVLGRTQWTPILCQRHADRSWFFFLDRLGVRRRSLHAATIGQRGARSTCRASAARAHGPKPIQAAPLRTLLGGVGRIAAGRGALEPATDHLRYLTSFRCIWSMWPGVPDGCPPQWDGTLSPSPGGASTTRYY